MDASSQEVRIKFVDEIFRTETRSSSECSGMNGDGPDIAGEREGLRLTIPLFHSALSYWPCVCVCVCMCGVCVFACACVCVCVCRW